MYLPGWVPPSPKVATPTAVEPKTSRTNVATPKVVAPRAIAPKVAERRTTASPVPAARHADRRDLIREAVERRLPDLRESRLADLSRREHGSAADPPTKPPLRSKDETLFAEKDGMTEERLEVLDELLKGWGHQIASHVLQ